MAPSPKAPTSSQLFARMLGEIRPYWSSLGLVLLLNLAGTAITLALPFPLKLAVDNAIGGKPLPAIFLALVPAGLRETRASLLAVICALQFLALLLQSLHGYLTWAYQLYVGEKLVIEGRTKLFEHVQRISLRRHDERGLPDLLYRLQNDVYNMQYVAIYGFSPFVVSIVTFVSMFSITYHLDPHLALVAIGVIPALVATSRFRAARARARWTEQKESEKQAIGALQDALTNIRVVQAFAQEERETFHFRRKAERSLKHYLGAVITETYFGSAVAALVAAASGVALYLGATHVVAGALTLGGFLVVMAYLAELFRPLESLSKQMSAMQAALTSAERVYSLLDEVPEVRDQPGALAVTRAKGRIEFRGVGFGYRPDRPLLRGIQFQAEPGQNLALIGATGSGKTTLMQLLMRFFDPTEGAIHLDGRDLRELRIHDLRRQIALVLQEPVLFSGTLAENIAYGRPEASEAEIQAAADAANAHDFITQMPLGYGTVVGERGMGLSGGQRQRVAMARAFLVDSPILILDEPTSALDLATEKSVLESLARLREGRTTFTISHRFDNLDKFDQRLRFGGGTITVEHPRARR